MRQLFSFSNSVQRFSSVLCQPLHALRGGRPDGVPALYPTEQRKTKHCPSCTIQDAKGYYGACVDRTFPKLQRNFTLLVRPRCRRRGMRLLQTNSPLTDEDGSRSFPTTRADSEEFEQISASTKKFEQNLAREGTTGAVGWLSGAHTSVSNSLGICYPHATSEPGGQIHVFPGTFQPRFSYQNIDWASFLDGTGVRICL
ncbi:hypothetical protein BD410DRAFT_166901 [Rickenella mellea]|uniref:Uncharacterized protein n=1 Tax=Rickenella mellea TaxID=50990 RepID=A0A4Y7PJT3_9AGAM|nr:hypothetical protein BD410DRAFT_166901 [Rickenella mellea]